jgi:hypothetical protein
MAMYLPTCPIYLRRGWPRIRSPSPAGHQPHHADDNHNASHQNE